MITPFSLELVDERCSPPVMDRLSAGLTRMRI